MHIGFLTPEYPDKHRPNGGLANYLHKLALELVARGHKVSIFVLSSENKKWQDNGIQLYEVKKFRFYWRLRKNAFLQKMLDFIEELLNSERLKRLILSVDRKDHLDILQTSNYRAPGISLCNNKVIPLVCRCSGYGPSLRAANGQRRTFKDTLQDWLENTAMLQSDATFVPSEHVANIYERFEALRPIVIRTPIELPSVIHDYTLYHELLAGKRYILLFGTLMGVKGVDLLIDIAPKLMENFPELFIVFIGSNGPIGGNVTAVELINRNLASYRDRVVYHPAMQRSQLYPIIQNSVAVIMPSRIDNYPNACLEAFALGVPVIGSYDSSLEEIIEDGKTGFLSKNNDSSSLYDAICRLLEFDEHQMRQMKENIKLAVETFKSEDRVGQLLVFYQKVITDFTRGNI